MKSKMQTRVENKTISLALYMNVQVPPAKEQPGSFLAENDLFKLNEISPGVVKSGILRRIKEKSNLSYEDLSRFSAFTRSKSLTLTWGEVLPIIGEDRVRTFIADLNRKRAKGNMQQPQQQICAA
ncbi:MAG: hypothetical protein WCV41_02240 [Patescibacteria group bacterium]